MTTEMSFACQSELLPVLVLHLSNANRIYATDVSRNAE